VEPIDQVKRNLT